MSSMDRITTAEAPALLDDLTDNRESKEPYRWCFGPRQDETEVARSRTLSTSPQIVKSDTPWEHQLELSHVAVGWYSLVFCVSLEEPNINLLESITFYAKLDDSDAKLSDSEEREIKYTSTMAVVRKEEIERRSRTCSTLLRLHQQTNISGSSKYLNLTITIGTTAETSVPLCFELHHIELTTESIQRSSVAEGPLYIYGEDKPDLFIKVGDSSTHPVKICAYDISDTGTHIATLYLINNTANLDIWDIRKQEEIFSKGTPQPMTAPSVRQSFQLEDGHESAGLDYDVAISSTGMQAAVCSLNESGKALVPFTIYSCWSETSAEHIPGRSRTLYKQLISRTRFKRAFGKIAFRTIDATTDPKDIERFFKFDGVTFDVYKPSGYWRRLFSIPVSLGEMSRDMMAKTLFYSIRKRLFAYTGTRGLVTIWDFETRRIVSNIFVPVDAMPLGASISRDGSLVAIAVKGGIHVHDVQSGIRLGSLNETNASEMEFMQDYLTTLDYATSTAEYASRPNTRSVVRVRDMSTVDTNNIQLNYRLQTPQANGAPIFAFDQGANLNIIKHKEHSPTEDIPWHTHCEATVDIIFHLFCHNQLDITTLDGTIFKLTASDGHTYPPSATILLISVEDERGAEKSAKISMGKTTHSFQGFYLKELSQLFILSDCYLQVWKLSATGNSICELAYIWKIDPDDPEHAGDYNYRKLLNAKTCLHRKCVHITLSPTHWIRHGENLPDDVLAVKKDIVSVPISPKDTFKTMTEEMRMMGGVQHLAVVYAEKDPSVQEYIIRYLMNCIRPSSKHSESSLASLCRAWSPENSACIGEIVAKLLPYEKVTWIPHMSFSKSKDPLAILLFKTRRWPAVSKLVKIFTGYCTHHATQTSEPSFLAPIFASMSDLMELLPVDARDFLTKVSYMPTKQRAFILQNHIIAHPPKAFLKFWQQKESLAEAKNPILQTNGTPAKPNHKNDEFHQELFVASFNMLWNYKENTKFKMARLNGNTWWKTLYHIFVLKLRLRTHTYIECHNFSLEVFDNPAVAALVSYKWNTIGFMYWSFRFTFQLIFYMLVIVAAFLQVFHDKIHKVQIMAVLIAIIVFGVAFLWLELLQAIKKGKKYRTIYNQLDVLAYSVPVGTSVQQMIALHENNPGGYTKILSFAVLIVFLHALFELRVFKGVCKSVSIIQHTVVEIRAFFFIFAAGIVAFTIATLHLLRACPVLEGCKELTTKFSGDFLRALSTTYFFIGGRYDDVDDEFVSQNWEFHLMMAVYFFFTVIVMLNVLIALINVAFTKGDDRWRLVWNESRLRYIESAEELSYHVPGFRQSHDWFPREIFYTKKARTYREKSQSKASTNEHHEVREDVERNGHDEEGQDQTAAMACELGTFLDEDGDASVVKELKVQVEQLQGQVTKQMEAQQALLEQSQRQFEELRELLSAPNRA